MFSVAERDGMAKLCIWNNDQQSATFFAFGNVGYHTVGRSCETAGIRKSNMKLVNEVDLHTKVEYKVHGCYVERTKIGEDAKLLR